MSRVRMALALADHVLARRRRLPVRVFEYAVIDGARVVTKVGRDDLDFATGPISATPKAGDQLAQAACDALR